MNRKVGLLLLTLIVGISLAFVPGVPTAHAATSSAAAAPVAPLNFSGPSVPKDPSKIPGVAVAHVTLSASLCTAMNRIRAGAAPGCAALYYSAGTNHEPLPAGTIVARTALTTTSAAYWYWSSSEWVCSIAGCWLAALTQTEDGVANGSNVWQWNHGCTPGGQNTNIQWCGYLYNGGGWPHYAMQFGLNGQFCIGPYNLGCINHGIRTWINDWGNRNSFYTW